MPISSKRPTLRDVARLAKVSAPTVSRVINNHPYVSDEKRKRVLDAMRAVGYQPNRAAQILSTRRSHLIQVIALHTTHSFFRNTLAHISFTAQQSGYQVLFAPVLEEDLPKTLSSGLARLVDGIILIAPGWTSATTDQEIQRLADGIPLAFLAIEPGSALPSVVYDQALGAHLVTQHLIDLGHRAIAEISGPLRMSDAVIRHNSWRETMCRSGLEPGPSIEGGFTVQSGYEAMNVLLSRNISFSALVAGNDRMALGALLALHEHGLRVPEDVSVVGFDDIEEAAYSIPPLTTVRQDLSALGRQITELLVSQIESPEATHAQEVLSPELIVRRSTRQLATSRGSSQSGARVP